MQGRRKPTALKKKDGSFRKDEAKNEPTAPMLLNLDAPEWLLDREAKVVWLKLAPTFATMGTLTEAGAPAFANACQAYADYLRMSKQIRKDGEVITGVNKAGNEYLAAHPLLVERDRRLQHFTKSIAKFGGNPSDAAKIDLPQKGNDDIASQLGLAV